MARGDPAEQALLRLEARRFASRCETQIAQIRRADALRELARLARIPLPYRLSDDYASRDIQRRLALSAEERAREIIQEQVQQFARADLDRQERLKHQMDEDWSNLTGPLGHLRVWAQGKLLAAEQGRFLSQNAEKPQLRHE